MLKCCGLRHDLVWLEWLHIYLPICNVLFDALDHGCLIFRMVGYILKMKFYYFHKLGIFASRPAFPDCVLQSHIGPSRCLLTQEVTVHINLEYPGYNVLLLEIYVHISVLETLRWFSMKELYFITFNQSFHCFFFLTWVHFSNWLRQLHGMHFRKRGTSGSIPFAENSHVVNFRLLLALKYCGVTIVIISQLHVIHFDSC